jgi:hypothetical protein
LIQVFTRTRNIDSKVRAPRFDCFKFEFHSICSVTFATQSANKRHMQRSKIAGYSITSSACNSSDAGIARPSAFAVLSSMTN